MNKLNKNSVRMLHRRAPIRAQIQQRIDTWFAANGWTIFSFQREVWRRIQKGENGLLHATTGSGKTLAVWLGAILKWARPKAQDETAQDETATAPLTVLWITPMRALAADTTLALSAAVQTLEINWSVGLRTSDTSASMRAQQTKNLPSALVTTPESLSLLLSRADAQTAFAHVQMVVVDEWHELLGNKRGVQTQLALARLAMWRPQLQCWGMSATLGNLPEACAALTLRGQAPATLVQAQLEKPFLLDTLIPETIERFPWVGHLGLRQLEPVAHQIEQSASTLVFTNTRSQAELWYRALLDLRPEWAGLIALHHGSLDKEIRNWVEQGLKNGQLKVVVCTSSLDLGVDFSPVERVLQIGSAKGVARLLQRAGRAGHAPGRTSRLTLVPTHALELLEAAAAKHAVALRQIEARRVPVKPFDVLAQHLVTIALGGGFQAEALYAEVRSCYAYRDLTLAEFEWVLGFVTNGGASLTAYPDYQRVVRDAQNDYTVPRKDLAQRHRMSIGTIVADAAMRICWLHGGHLGTVEETFISRLRPGDRFIFSGHSLELVRVRDMIAYVRKAKGNQGIVPQWQGGRMPLSSELAQAALTMLELAQRGHFDAPEMQALKPLLDIQMTWSALPTPQQLVCESLKTREGYHFFCYPFAGRTAHIGLAALLAWRAARNQADTFSLAANDYGFELLSATPFDWRQLIGAGLFSTEHLLEDILASINASELAQRRFREIARIAGLIFIGYPGASKSVRQIQASSHLFFEVFRKHDPSNLLLEQAQREALEQELEVMRMREALVGMQHKTLSWNTPPKATPFAFPLLVERLREKVSTEKLSDRVQRMLATLEKAATEGNKNKSVLSTLKPSKN